MSNLPTNHDRKQRVIQIKPVSFVKEQKWSKDDLVQEQQLIENELKKQSDELLHMKQQKEMLLQETEAEIAKVKENWEIEKQHYIEQANEKGYAAGFAKGEEESLREYQSLLQDANAIIEAAQKDYLSKIEQADDQILDLSIHVAEKILKQHISERPESFVAIVAAAIKEIKDQSVISIYLHPNNYEHVVDQKNELMRILDNKAALSIYVDDEAAEGKCLIEHAFGQIDASIDTQLAEIRSLLQELVMENE